MLSSAENRRIFADVIALHLSSLAYDLAQRSRVGINELNAKVKDLI